MDYNKLIDKMLGTNLAQDNKEHFLKTCIQRDDILNAVADKEKPFLIINSARGEGKSGLLLNLENKLPDSSNTVMIKYFTDIEDDFQITSLNSHIKFWQNQLLGWVFSSIGSSKKFAMFEAAINATEYAEKTGEKGKSLISTILDKLKFKGSPLEKASVNPLVREPEIQRLLDDMDHDFWLLLDEMDDHFDNSLKKKESLAGLLVAAKAISIKFKNINIRITIRPHIMRVLQMEFDKVQTYSDYLITFTWKEIELRHLLSKRVKVFLEEYTDFSGRLSLILPELGLDKKTTESLTVAEREELLIRHFVNSFDLSFNPTPKRNVIKSLSTLSFSRPRWMIEYLKNALRISGSDFKVTPEIAKKAMYDYGIDRITYTVGEHGQLCPNLLEVINQFSNIKKQNLGKSEELKKIIIDRIIKPGIVIYEGVSEEQSALRVAQTLYMIEFLRAREKLSDLDDHRFSVYKDRPDLLRTWETRGEIKWHLHPVFAKALYLDDDRNYRAQNEVKTAPIRKEKVRTRNTISKRRRRKNSKTDS